ncbi:MAG: OmpH family outer membrane protein [Crocinitomicaceae bacterium]|nr:OmpH family outer membrane protein [Crocinitomicaceae bacterium]
MKKILVGLLMMVSFGTMAQVKIGFVDSQKLLDTMPSRKAALEKYKSHEKSLSDEFNILRADLEKAYADYQAKQGDLTPVLRAAAEKKIMDKERSLQDRQETIQQELQAYGEELNVPILDRVQKAIGVIADKQKLSMVVDKSSTLYFDPSMDITSQVVVELLKLEKEAK